MEYEVICDEERAYVWGVSSGLRPNYGWRRDHKPSQPLAPLSADKGLSEDVDERQHDCGNYSDNKNFEPVNSSICDSTYKNSLRSTAPVVTRSAVPRISSP